MIVQEVTDRDALASLRAAWESTYAADEHASVFLSWPWVTAFLSTRERPWAVAVVRPAAGEDPCGFLLIVEHGARYGVLRETWLGASVGDYCGVLAPPAHEGEVAAALGAHLARRGGWELLRTGHYIDPRMDRVLDALHADDGRLEIHRDDPVPCPSLDLPADFETYLQEVMHGNIRRKMLRCRRRFAEREGFRTSITDAASLEVNTDALLTMWSQRWNRSGEPYRPLLRACLENDCLWLGCLWLHDEPLAALAGFTDPVKRTFSFFITGFNPEIHPEMSTGQLIQLESIEHAVRRGDRRYDFLRGNEAYKYKLGAVDRTAQAAEVRRPGLRRAIAPAARVIARLRRRQ